MMTNTVTVFMTVGFIIQFGLLQVKTNEDEMGIMCRGVKKKLHPKVVEVFTECRQQVINSHQPYFEIACRAKKYGIVKEGQPWNLTELAVLVTRMYPPEFIPVMTEEFLKCAEPLANIPYKDDENCGRMVHMVRCIRDAIYRQCLNPSEDMVNTHTGNTVDKLVTYSTCKDTVLTHSPKLVQSYKDCAHARQNSSVADVYRCLYQLAGILSVEGDLNETAITLSWGPSFKSDKIKGELEDFAKSILVCYKELGPIGKYKEAEPNTESAPFFTCVHREFFRICRPGQHVVLFGSADAVAL